MDARGQLYNSGVLCWEAIENAGGVPFQLIFGSTLGEGYYSDLGKGIRDLFGIEPEEFSEKYFLEMIDKIIPLSCNISPELSVSREKFIRGELTEYKAEVLINMPGGDKRWIRDTSVPLIDELTGKVIGASGILFNINEYKMYLNSMERDKRHAMDSDRLKSAFLRNLSHEIRTPLNAIVGFSSLLNEPENNPMERQEITDILMRNTDHLLELFTDIIEISNIEADAVMIRKSEINIKEILGRIQDRFRKKAIGKGILLDISYQPVDSANIIFADNYKLFQILTYLLDNAIKFTEKGKVEVRYSINDKIIKFTISDTGIGIPPELHGRIFDRFYQVESGPSRRYEGAGLGLSISKAYIELHGGEIWFTSQPGEGSVFYFTLPNDRKNV